MSGTPPHKEITKQRLIITGCIVVTMDAERRVHAPGVIIIEDGWITAVLPEAQAEERFLDNLPRAEAERRIHRPHGIAMPGLINAHTHVSEVLLRGSRFPGRDLYDWQWNINYPAIRRFSDRDSYVAALLFSIDALRSGTTTFVDNANTGFSISLIESAISAYAFAGVRNILAPIFATAPLADDRVLQLARMVQTSSRRIPPEDMLQPIDEVFRTMEYLLQTHNGSRDGLQGIWPAPHKPSRTSLESIVRSYDLAERWNVRVSQPCSEVEAESLVCGIGAIDFLYRNNCLNERTLLGHAVYVTNRELRLLKESRANVVHLVGANLYLGSGIAPIPSFLLAGITVALGTDNANCNDSVNMFREMTLCALLHRGVQRDAGAISAPQVLAMATCDAATAIGAEESLGRLQPGMRGDIVVMDAARANLTPLHDPTATLIYQAIGSEIDVVIVDGVILIEDNRLTFMSLVEEAELRSEAQRRSAEILRRSVLS